MVIGSCPYDGCDEPLMLSAPDSVQFPAYYRHKCKGCKKIIWTKFSRIDPCSWTEEGFLEEFIIDKKTKHIELRNPPKPLTDKEKLFNAIMNKEITRMLRDYFIYGVSIDPNKKYEQ